MNIPELVENTVFNLSVAQSLFRFMIEHSEYMLIFGSIRDKKILNDYNLLCSAELSVSNLAKSWDKYINDHELSYGYRNVMNNQEILKKHEIIVNISEKCSYLILMFISYLHDIMNSSPFTFSHIITEYMDIHRICLRSLSSGWYAISEIKISESELNELLDYLHDFLDIATKGANRIPKELSDGLLRRSVNDIKQSVNMYRSKIIIEQSINQYECTEQ